MEIRDEITNIVQELIDVVSSENEALEANIEEGRNALSMKKLVLSDVFSALNSKVKAEPNLLVEIDVEKRDELTKLVKRLKSLSNKNATLLEQELDEVTPQSMEGDEILAHLMGNICS